MKALLFLFLVVGAICPLASSAQAQALRPAVEGAWALNSELAGLAAKRETILARRRAAAGWFPGPPAISLSHTTDQLIENKRQRTTEGELSVPLWLPGEGTASEQLADSDLLNLDAQLAALKLKLAGEVREALYALALAQAEVATAETRVRTARSLQADVDRKQRAGEVADLDRDLVRAELLDAQSKNEEKRAAAVAAEASFLALTGVRPGKVRLDEPLAVMPPLDVHPQVQAAFRAVDAARATLRLAIVSDRESPEIGIVAGRNRDIRGPEYDNMIGLRLKIPFASEGRNAPRRAQAQAQLTAAEAGYAAARRQITAEIAAAGRALSAAQTQVPLAEARLRALRQAQDKLQRSYNAGEIGLADLLRNRSSLYDAEAAAAVSHLNLLRARGRFNHAAGLVP